MAALRAPTAGRRASARWRPSPACGCPAGAPAPAERQVFTGFSTSPPVLRPVVPVLEAVHDRVVVEVMRGCTAGCRFCQAGMWYRPVRERPVDLVVEAADRLLDETGCDEVSLLSLSSCDYSGVEEALTRIRGLRPGLRVSLPSLRIDSAAESLARFAADQRGSVTLAPEAGTQELRDAINKGVDEAQFDEAVRATFEGGFTGLKLYFMIGLPGETDEDVLGIARMAATAARLAKEIGRGRARLSVSVSSYVPKAHTPFELEPFAGESHPAPPPAARARGHAARRARVLPRRRRLDGGGHPGARRTGQRPAGRGGLAQGRALRRLERALRRSPLGGRGRGHGRRARRGRTVDRASWRDAVDARLDQAFLDDELARSRDGELTEDCRDGACAACGVCGAESRWRCSHDLVAAQLRAPRPGPLPLAPRHGARRAAHLRARRHPHRAVAGHATQAAPLAAAAAAGGRGRRGRARRGRGAGGRRATTAALKALRAASPPGFEPLGIVDVGERHPRPQPTAAEYACLLDGDAGAIAAAVERYSDAEDAIRERVSPKGTRRSISRSTPGTSSRRRWRGEPVSGSPSATGATARRGHRNSSTSSPGGRRSIR